MYHVPRESEWISVGILNATCQCAEVGWPWACATVLGTPNALHTLVEINTCRPSAAVLRHCCPHNSVNKVCALCVTASTPGFLSGSPAPFQGLSHLKKCQPNF